MRVTVEGIPMGSWEPIITDDQYVAWNASFHERHGASPWEVLNGRGTYSDAAYAEAYGIWLTHMERMTAGIGGI